MKRKIDDTILLKSLKEGDEKAFDRIFQEYSGGIYQFLLFNCKSVVQAEDLTQEVFLKLWEKRGTPVISLKAYLFSIAKSTLIDWTRKSVNKQIFKALQEEDFRLTAEGEEDEKAGWENLLNFIHQTAQGMPEKRLEVYRLRWIEGLSRKEIAERMNITITTVDIHIRKVLDYLKETVSKHPGLLFFFILSLYLS